MKRIAVAVFAVVGLLSIAGCGGSGGDDDTPSGSSNWDEMVWDQDSWA